MVKVIFVEYTAYIHAKTSVVRSYAYDSLK